MGIATAQQRLRKTPTEIVIYTMDFSGKMDSDETISTVSSVTITPSGASHLVKDAQSISGQMVSLQFSAGVVETIYRVFVEVTTSAGQTLDGQGLLEVRAA